MAEEMIKLKVVSSYTNQRVTYAEGEIIEVTTSEAAWLQNDAPGSFKIYVPPKKRVRRKKSFGKPTKDKMVRSSTTKEV